jgi:hypothetical protein
MWISVSCCPGHFNCHGSHSAIVELRVHLFMSNWPTASSTNTHTHAHTHTRGNTMKQITSLEVDNRSLGWEMIHDFRNYHTFHHIKSTHHEPLEANQYFAFNTIEIHSTRLFTILNRPTMSHLNPINTLLSTPLKYTKLYESRLQYKTVYLVGVAVVSPDVGP